MEITKQQKEEFKRYFNLFYSPKDKESIYPIKGLTDDDIMIGLGIRLEKHSHIMFDGDTTDRELVYAEVLRLKGLVRNG